MQISIRTYKFIVNIGPLLCKLAMKGLHQWTSTSVCEVSVSPPPHKQRKITSGTNFQSHWNFYMGQWLFAEGTLARAAKREGTILSTEQKILLLPLPHNHVLSRVCPWQFHIVHYNMRSHAQMFHISYSCNNYLSTVTVVAIGPSWIIKMVGSFSH